MPTNTGRVAWQEPEKPKYLSEGGHAPEGGHCLKGSERSLSFKKTMTILKKSMETNPSFLGTGPATS